LQDCTPQSVIASAKVKAAITTSRSHGSYWKRRKLPSMAFYSLFQYFHVKDIIGPPQDTSSLRRP
jgi:hypothetical protein